MKRAKQTISDLRLYTEEIRDRCLEPAIGGMVSYPGALQQPCHPNPTTEKVESGRRTYSPAYFDHP